MAREAKPHFGETFLLSAYDCETCLLVALTHATFPKYTVLPPLTQATHTLVSIIQLFGVSYMYQPTNQPTKQRSFSGT